MDKRMALSLPPRVRELLSFRQLSWVQRYNLVRIQKKQSDAEHMYYVAILALLISDEINNMVYYPDHKDKKAKTKIKIDTEKVLVKSLMHDAGEHVTGDSFFGLHEFFPGLKDVENDFVKSICGKKGHLLRKYTKFMTDGGRDRSPEWKVVKMADHLEAYLFCGEEILLGNAFALVPYKNARKLCLGHVEESPWLETQLVKDILDTQFDLAI